MCLDPQLDSVGLRGVEAEGQSIAVIRVLVRFAVKNVSRVVAREWDVAFEPYHSDDQHRWRFKEPHQQASYESLLPTRTGRKAEEFGFRVQRDQPLGWQLRNGLCLAELEYRAIAENYPGAPKTVVLGEFVDINAFEKNVETALTNVLSWH